MSATTPVALALPPYTTRSQTPILSGITLVGPAVSDVQSRWTASFVNSPFGETLRSRSSDVVGSAFIHSAARRCWRYNRKRIAQALQTVDPFSIKQDWSIDDLDIEIAGFTHAVLPQLAFLSRYVPRGPLAALRQAYVRDAGVKGIPSNPAMLEDHALLLRSFATEIPTDMIELGLGDGQIRSRVPSCNPRGVTVLDVVLTIYAELDVPLAYENVWDFVRGHQEHFTDALWAQESREVFGYLRTLRAVHNTCPVSRFGYNWPMAMRVRHPYFMIYLK